MLLPKRQQHQIFDKVDDVRYDIRRLGNRTSAGLLALSGAVAALAVASVYKAAKEP